MCRKTRYVFFHCWTQLHQKKKNKAFNKNSLDSPVLNNRFLHHQFSGHFSSSCPWSRPAGWLPCKASFFVSLRSWNQTIGERFASSWKHPFSLKPSVFLQWCVEIGNPPVRKAKSSSCQTWLFVSLQSKLLEHRRVQKWQSVKEAKNINILSSGSDS